MSSDEAKGLLASLFDFGFTSLITLKVIRFVYALLVILLSIGAIFFFIGGIATGRAAGILSSLIVLPIVYLVYLILIRIWMEILIVVFRLGEDVRAIRLGGGLSQGPDRPG